MGCPREPPSPVARAAPFIGPLGPERHAGPARPSSPPFSDHWRCSLSFDFLVSCLRVPFSLKPGGGATVRAELVDEAPSEWAGPRASLAAVLGGWGPPWRPFLGHHGISFRLTLTVVGFLQPGKVLKCMVLEPKLKNCFPPCSHCGSWVRDSLHALRIQP